MSSPPPSTPERPTDGAAEPRDEASDAEESHAGTEPPLAPLSLSESPGAFRRARTAITRRVKRLLWTAVYRTTGRRLQPTARFEALTHVAGVFDADATVARRIVPDAFEVVETDDRTLVTVAAYEYRRVNVIGPYREVSINLPVRYRADDSVEPGTYVLAMPVTTEEARWAGRVNAGFPKLLGAIDMTSTPECLRTKLTVGGQHVLTLTVDAEPVSPFEESGRVFNVRDGMVTTSTATLSGAMGGGDRAGGARLELGTHPVADLLRALDASPTSTAHAYTPEGEAVLESSSDLGPATGGGEPGPQPTADEPAPD